MGLQKAVDMMLVYDDFKSLLAFFLWHSLFHIHLSLSYIYIYIYVMCFSFSLFGTLLNTFYPDKAEVHFDLLNAFVLCSRQSDECHFSNISNVLIVMFSGN